MTKASIPPENELYLWFNQIIYYFYISLFFIYIVATHTKGIDYTTGSSVSMMLVLFSLFLIYTRGIKRGILQNNIIKLICYISMEIYLCHTVIFRVIKKIGLAYLFVSDTLNYVFTTVGTIIGAIVFAVVVKKGFRFAGKLVRKYRLRSFNEP